jgi:hypothetical protein
METKFSSSSGFSHQCSAQELFVLTTHWVSDINFFEHEINFLKCLIHSHFLPAVDEKEAEALEFLKDQLIDISEQKNRLKEDIITHQNKLSAILDMNFTREEYSKDRIHATLEGELLDFVKSYRKVKRKLFKAYEEIQSKALMHSKVLI